MLDLPLKTISKEEFYLNNLLYSRKRFLEFNDILSIEIGLENLNGLNGYEINLLIGCKRLSLYFNTEQLQVFLNDFLGATSFDILPSLMQLEMLTLAMEPYQSQLDSFFEQRVIIDSIKLASLGKRRSKTAVLTIKRNNLSLSLWFKDNAEFIFKLFPLVKNVLDDYIYLNISFCVGRVGLTSAEISEISIGDVIFLDENYIDNNNVVLMISNKPIWRCSLNDNSFTILNQEAKKPMSKESTNIEDIPVILSFEIGEQSISVSGLNQLQEQYIFEFDNQIDQQVKIKVNGRSLGVGELVKVNEHIGVRLLKFNHQTDYSYYEETSKYNKLDINYDEEIDYEDSNNFEDNEDNEDELIDKQMNHGHMD